MRVTLGVGGGKLGGFDCGFEGVLQPLERAMSLEASVPVTAQRTRSANVKLCMAICLHMIGSRGWELLHRAGDMLGESAAMGAPWGMASLIHEGVGQMAFSSAAGAAHA